VQVTSSSNDRHDIVLYARVRRRRARTILYSASRDWRLYVLSTTAVRISTKREVGSGEYSQILPVVAIYSVEASQVIDQFDPHDVLCDLIGGRALYP
jgi:hypothetical protein